MRSICVLVCVCLFVSLAPATEPIDETPIDDFDRDHWSFRPVQSPPIPTVKDAYWPRTRIDSFVLKRLEDESLRPAAEADRPTLIRRVSFDLLGLPPTVQQLNEFLNDESPAAYRRLIDRMLASPQYGQRWAQFWLDLARFAETDGYEHDKVRSTAWQYRDWVVDALNEDLPLSDFITAQLAGDVLAPDDPTSAIPTSFCLSGPDMPDINSQEERKHVLLNELASTVGSVFLSLQMGCAQCHDHKYDAISQADFYRLRAFFDPSVSLARNKSVNTLAPAADPESNSHLYYRGDWRSPGPTVMPEFPRIANGQESRVVAKHPGERRLQLARWLVSPAQPLTARSLVNRIWQFHFGQGLSTTPSDFGVMGESPSHPLLLDHLASELQSRRWSLKDLHRQILLSATYRTESRLQEDQEAVDWQQLVSADPVNRLLGRFPRRRLDAEAIRDALYSVSGSLNHETGGPGVRPPLPPEMLKTLLKGQWKESTRVADHYRRSVYIFARRNLRYPLFATFDRPAANCSCAVRHPSNTAVQSLLLLNSKLTLDAARRLAAVVQAEDSQTETQIRSLHQRLFARAATMQEIVECNSFLDEQRTLTSESDPSSPTLALTELCRALLNSNEFLFVD